jgi:hypothetical protein
MMLLVAAALVLLTALGTAAAVATDLFGLRQALLPQKEQVIIPLDPDTGGQTTETVDVLSLSGFQDSPESQALAEWRAWLEGYDTDGALLAQVGNGATGLDAQYDLYLVYTQEMADKLDEIVAKYDLKLHSYMVDDVMDGADLEARVGGAFLGDNQAYSAYLYEDGTFHFDGDLALPGYGTLDYQFTRTVRGTFNDVLLNVGDASQYEEWTYATGGVTVTLALGPSKGLVLLNLPDSFVTLNVLAGSESYDAVFSSGPITRETLEALADSFDFSVLTPALPQAQPVWTEYSDPEPEEDELYIQTGISTRDAQDFYAAFTQVVAAGDRHAVGLYLSWPCVLADGAEEITLQSAQDLEESYDRVFTPGLMEAILENQYDETRADLFARNGLVGAAGGCIWFGLLDGTLQVVSVQAPDGATLRPAWSA